MPLLAKVPFADLASLPPAPTVTEPLNPPHRWPLARSCVGVQGAVLFLALICLDLRHEGQVGSCSVALGWMPLLLSIRPSVRPSVCPSVWLACVHNCVSARGFVGGFLVGFFFFLNKGKKMCIFLAMTEM